MYRIYSISFYVNLNLHKTLKKTFFAAIFFQKILYFYTSIHALNLLFKVLINFLKSYTSVGRYVSDKHYKNIYYTIIFIFIVFILFNILMYV